MTSFPTIAGAARDIAAKRISPVELMQDHLARSEKLNPTLHAFIRFTPEIALEQARAAEARQMAGALRGPLDGIPIGSLVEQEFATKREVRDPVKCDLIN